MGAIIGAVLPTALKLVGGLFGGNKSGSATDGQQVANNNGGGAGNFINSIFSALAS